MRKWDQSTIAFNSEEFKRFKADVSLQTKDTSELEFKIQ